MADGRYFKVPPEWEIDLTLGSTTNFRALVFRLIQKADPGNLAKIRKAFPEEVAVYEAWMAGDGSFPAEVTIG